MADYNNIYELLVRDKSDMVGRIAYSLYKEEKIEWIKRFKIENKREPTDDEIEKEFHVSQRQKGCRERYRMQAEGILQEFTDNTLEQSVSQIENECMKGLLEKLASQKEGWLSRLLFGALQSIIGSVILALCIWLLVDIVGKFSIGNTEIEFKNKMEHVEKQDSVKQNTQSEDF